MGQSMIELIVLVMMTAGLLLLSRDSLRDLRKHGFYRFFAFECILVLVVLSAKSWFREPFSTCQVVSWILLLSSAILAIHGFWMLRTIGRPDGSIENTSRLVRQGAYRYVRHPLYSTLLLGAWGAFLKNVSVVGGVLAILATGFTVATAKVEEIENLHKFGAGYRAYMKTTRMLIPYVF
jgi:protein-S-isoprenylcysteine O-methyltransferase Ste14